VDGAESELVNAAAICQRAVRGESLALAAIDREAEYLGIGLSNLINTFVPQVIVLGGGVMQSWDLFAERVQTMITRNCSTVPYQKTELRLASLGAYTGLVGAAQVWHHRFRSTRS
jgi:glucokinase